MCAHVSDVLLTFNPSTRRFIEHGEYKENQYGTSIEAIRSVRAKNKMCIVDVQPEVRIGSSTTSCHLTHTHV